MDFNQLQELLAAIAATDIAELTLKSANFELTVRKGIPLAPIGELVAPAPVTPIGSAAPTTVTVSESTTTTVTTPAATPVEKNWVDVKSPMVGTFYHAPAPDEPPFAQVGDRVRLGQTVCIIEAMKLMNEIEAELSGEVMEVLVENGQPVEYGQTLMRIKRD
ncbi:acetyl-CoA carboxylase biotin carboxyl carrier protein [Merismopedia glauca]